MCREHIETRRRRPTGRGPGMGRVNPDLSIMRTAIET
jgi:hypothetical protein